MSTIDSESQPLLRGEDQQNGPRDRDLQPERSRDHYLSTLLCVLIGSVVGVLVCLSNIHFGLQTGYVNIMQMQSAFVGFAVMKTLSRYINLPFGRGENILIQTISSSIGAMPSGAGLIGVMPAMEYLLPEPIHLSFTKLCIWAAGISLFGLFFAAIMRKRIIIYENLRFPTGTASALMINVLHQPETSPSTLVGLNDASAARAAQIDEGLRPQKLNWRSSVILISTGIGISAVYTIVTYFIPLMRDIPIFGHVAASRWLWTINLSPGYFGQGIITGLPALLNMLAGAIIGWGILSPLAKSKQWAPGPVSDWDTGSRGWILWISLIIMLADALVSFVSFTVRSFYQVSSRPEEEDLLVTGPPEPNQPKSSGGWSISRLWLVTGLLGSGLCCLASVKIALGDMVSTTTISLAIIIALPLCLMGINAVGTTDHSPASGIAKISQLAVGAIVRRNNPHAIVENLVAGGIAEAGVVTAGFLMQTFKTTHIVGANPTWQLLGMLYGTIVGGAVASGLYRLYTAVYTVPGETFGVPSAFVWRAGARLAIGQNLPAKVPEFGWAMGICFATFSLIRIRFSKHRWSIYVPSGVPFAVGMYLVPSFTLVRAIGAFAAFYWISILGRPESSIFVLASGLVLGEGLASIVNLILESFHIPHL